MKKLSALTRSAKSSGKLPSASVMVALVVMMSAASHSVPQVFFPYSRHPPPGCGTALMSASPLNPARCSENGPNIRSPSATRPSQYLFCDSLINPPAIPTMM